MTTNARLTNYNELKYQQSLVFSSHSNSMQIAITGK